jgi:PAS domain S-box-containing protein
VLVILWLAALGGPAVAGPQLLPVPAGQLKFRAFGGADGLRNLVLSSITQDRDGLLWIGTQDGVYRFDGERFAHFSEADGLPSTLIQVVGVAPDGAPCVGTLKGLVCWDGTRFSAAMTRGLPAVAVTAIATYGGKLWAGTDGKGLFVQDGNGGFVPAPGWPGAAATAIRALWADAEGLVVSNDATVELSTGDGAWRHLDAIGLGLDRIDGLLRDRQGALWIRTPTHLWQLPRGQAHATDLSAGLPTGYAAIGTPATMAIGPRGDVLVATDNGISYRERDHWRTIDHTTGMPMETVRTLFVDREATIWAGVVGLLQMRGRGIIEHNDKASGIPGEVVWMHARDPHGALLTGTNRCLARANAERWACVPGTEDRVVRSVVFPPQGGMFVGGSPSDLLYIDDAGRVSSLGDRDRPDRHIRSMVLGPEGDLWIGTKSGLFQLHGAVPGPIEPVKAPGSPSSGWIFSLVTVGEQLWVGAMPGGLFVRDHGTWHGFGKADGLLAEAVTYMVARADGRVCMSYAEALGVTCFRYDGKRLTELEHFGVAQGLTTGMVYFLGEDRDRRLWIGTGDGIDVVTPRGIDHLDQSDGLAGNDSAGGSFLLQGDGSLWMGSTGGATHVFAQYYTGAPDPPRTAFLAGQLGGRPIANDHAALEVPHDRSGLTLEIAANSLLDPKRIEYQVRLSPLESEWSTTQQRQVRYSALLPDGYRLEARARIDAGRWGPTTELRFTVRQAWWRAPGFIVAIVLAGLAVIAAAFTWRQRIMLRRRIRQLHAQADASFRTMIDRMPDLISVHRDNKLLYRNRAFRKFLGVAPSDDELDELVVLERIHPDDRAALAALERRARELDSPAASDVIEIRVRSPDGSWRICELSRLLVEIGGAPTMVTSGRDITERNRLRAKLMVSDRMASLGTLAAGIAHEINNPLAYVTGNLEAMAETVLAGGQAPIATERADLSAAIHEARDGAERVRKIVQGLRSFSRSEEERRVPLALTGVIEAAIRLTANEVRHRAQLVREIAPTPRVIADDGKLTQVFINLLINAAHAIPEGHADRHQITVRTRTDDQGRAMVEIEDTGRGIAHEVQSRVFDPFFTTKNVGEGTGLGLSICHGIISGLGGQISIDSAPDRGTVIRVVLPPGGEAGEVVASPVELVAPPVELAPPVAVVAPPVAVVAPVELAPPAAAPVLTRPRVLLVDDEPMVAQTIERLLRRDYEIMIASCGQDAIGLIAGGTRFDAIVSDVMMPNMTGIELLEELQRDWPDQAARVIFLSGGAFTAQARERLETLGAPQLEKPVSAKELRACVSRVARGASCADERNGPM